MQIVKLDEAKANLTALIEDAVKGKSVFIMDDDQRIVQLRPSPQVIKRAKPAAQRVWSRWLMTLMPHLPILTSTPDEVTA